VIVKREGTLDEVEVKVEVSETVFREVAQDAIADDIMEIDARIQGLRNRIQYQIKGTIGLNMRVILVPPDTIPRSEGGKLRRVVDLRKL
jgi:phenylacetate-CoA ligase